MQYVRLATIYGTVLIMTGRVIKKIVSFLNHEYLGQFVALPNENFMWQENKNRIKMQCSSSWKIEINPRTIRGITSVKCNMSIIPKLYYTHKLQKPFAPTPTVKGWRKNLQGPTVAPEVKSILLLNWGKQAKLMTVLIHRYQGCQAANLKYLDWMFKNFMIQRKIFRHANE